MIYFIQILLLFPFLFNYSVEQPVPVRLHYDETTPSPSGAQVIKLSGDLQGQTYKIRMAHYKEGVVSYKILNEQAYVIKDTVFSIRIAVEPLHAHEVDFTVEGETQIVEKAEVEDVLHSILLETYPTRIYTSDDTIPLTSYTSGALYEVMLEGKKQQAGSYCDVRNAKLPPKEWHEAFNMKEYIWFDLFFCHMSTVN